MPRYQRDQRRIRCAIDRRGGKPRGKLRVITGQQGIATATRRHPYRDRDAVRRLPPSRQIAAPVAALTAMLFRMMFRIASSTSTTAGAKSIPPVLGNIRRIGR